MSHTLKALWLTPNLLKDVTLLGLTIFEPGEGEEWILTAEGAQICKIVAESHGLDPEEFAATLLQHYAEYAPLAQDVDMRMEVDALGKSAVAKPIP